MNFKWLLQRRRILSGDAEPDPLGKGSEVERYSVNDDMVQIAVNDRNDGNTASAVLDEDVQFAVSDEWRVSVNGVTVTTSVITVVRTHDTDVEPEPLHVVLRNHADKLEGLEAPDDNVG